MPRGLVSFMITVLLSALLPGRALALLSNDEKSALTRVYQLYQKSQSVGAFRTSLRPWLDLETQVFLSQQIKRLEHESLPKMTVINPSRIKFKQGTTVTTVDFISLRTNLLAINGVEVEFLPDDDKQTRWKKLLTVLQQRSKSARHPFPVLFPEANAKDSFKDRQTAIADNLTVISMLVYGINSSAEYQSLCAKDSPDGPKKDYPGVKEKCEKLAIFIGARKAAPENMYQPKTLGAMQSLGEEAKKAKASGPYNCSKIEREQAADLEENKFKDLGGGADIEHHRGFFRSEDVAKLNKEDKLNDTFRAKLQGIREQMAQFKDTDAAENVCRKAVQVCVRDLLEQVEERTHTRALRCFMERIIEEIGSDGNPGRPAQAPPQAPAQPNNR